MDSKKNRSKHQSKNQSRNQNINGLKKTGHRQLRMKTENRMATRSNPESEVEEEPNVPASTLVPSGSSNKGGSSIKVTLKKTGSCSSSSSSRESFEVVKSVPPAPDNVSSEVSSEEDDENDENGENIMDTNNKISHQAPSDDRNGENDKSVENKGSEKNENDHEKESSGEESEDIENIEISSDDSQDDSSFAVNKSLAAPVKIENKEEKNLPLKTELKSEEIPQNSTVVKKEECRVKIKSLKEELVNDLDSDVVVLQDDDDNVSAQVSQPKHEVEKKEVKGQKFKVHVRNFNDLASPQPSNLINMPHPHPGQIEPSSNFLSQNGSPFSSPFTIACEVCGSHFDSPELLNDHRATMKHYKCSFKDCEHLVMSSTSELADHQRMIHNIMPSPVQQLAHQVQRLPSMSFDQQLQSGVPPMPDNMPHTQSNMYSQQLRMTSQQQMPMQRSMRPMMRPALPPHMMSSRGRSVPRARGRGMSMSPMSSRGGSLKRPLMSTPLRGTPPLKRVATDRNSYSNSMNNKTQIVKSLSESLTKSLTSANKPPPPSQQDVVNLFSKRGLTISTVDTVNNISLPAGLSLNSAVSIIPTSPLKVPNNFPKATKAITRVSHNSVPQESLDTVDLTGPDKPREKKFFPCEICSKTYTSVETLYEHISTSHKSIAHSYKCNLCSQAFPSGSILNHHKTTFHKLEVNSNIPAVIPILDLTKPSTLARLQSMGVTNYLPVAQLDNQGGGNYGVPIMSISRPGTVEGLKYTNFFNLGCIRKM